MKQTRFHSNRRLTWALWWKKMITELKIFVRQNSKMSKSVWRKTESLFGILHFHCFFIISRWIVYCVVWQKKFQVVSKQCTFISRVEWNRFTTSWNKNRRTQQKKISTKECFFEIRRIKLHHMVFFLLVFMLLVATRLVSIQFQSIKTFKIESIYSYYEVMKFIWHQKRRTINKSALKYFRVWLNAMVLVFSVIVLDLFLYWNISSSVKAVSRFPQ